jgi:putative glycosyltransferase
MSEDRIAEFCKRTAEVAEQLAGDDYEIILVNDGSPDNSLAISRELISKNNRIRIVDLSRNFGHHKAMMTGLAHTRGEFVFLLDSDLEEDPEWLVQFNGLMKSSGCDVVYGVQEKRRGRMIERFSGYLFYKMASLLSGLKLPANAVTARLMRRSYVDALLRHDEREMFIAGLWYLTGYDQRPTPVKKLRISPTTYSLGRKLHQVIIAVTSFSNAPLLAIFYIGIFISIISSLYSLFLISNWLLIGNVAEGWTSVMASIWLLGGIMISFMGIIGLYLSNIYMETKRRPYTIVKNIYDSTVETNHDYKRPSSINS